MPLIRSQITHNDFKYLKAKFEMPRTDNETELLIYNPNHDFYSKLEYFSTAERKY